MAFSRWFRLQPSSSGSNPSGWRHRLSELDKAAERAAPGYQGTPLNRAGDLCLKGGEQDRALEYYGRAIDAFLEDGQPEAARGVANKIIRIHPGAVRTLCTLTWLDLAAAHNATALIHLGEYKEACLRAHRESLAADQILDMARVSAQRELIDAAADALDQLGFPDEGARARRWAKEGGSPDALTDSEALSEHCIRAAVGSISAG